MSPTPISDLSRPVSEFALPVETAIDADLTVSQALEALRSRKIEHKIVYFYVVDKNRKLVGVLPTRRLLLSAPTEAIRNVMDSPPISLSETMTIEEAMEMFAMHRLLAFPVVDTEGRLTGHVGIDLYADEALDLSESLRTAELFQLIGFSVQQARAGTPWSGYFLRMPWLVCNVIGGIACAAIAAAFSIVLGKVLIVAMFIPLVLTLSESISMQSMTLSLGQVRFAAARMAGLWRRLWAEGRTVLLVGLSCGLLGALAAGFSGNAAAAGVIAISIAASMLAASALGVAVPVILHRFHLDPKVAAGPVVLMVGDIVTTSVYLGLATWLLV